MKLRLGFGIFPKLLLTMLVVTLIPLGAIWYLDYRTESETLSNQIEQRLNGQADTMVGYVDAWVDMHLRMLRQNAALDDLASMDAKKQKPLLRAIAAEYKWVYLAFTIAPDGNNVGRNDEEPPRFYGDRGYFKQAIDGRQMGQEVVISRTTGQPAVILAVPIWRLDKVLGVLAVGTSISDVTTTIANAKIGQSGFVFLVDEQGKVIAHPNARDSLKANPAVVALGGEAKKQLVYADAAGKRIIAVAAKTKYGWTLVAQQDYEEAYQPLVEATRNALILLGVTVLFVLLASYALANALTRPIRKLTQISDGISRGNLAAAITETRRSDEIGSLARAIERLRASVKLAVDRLGAR
ncbi:MAG TPA: cache domain-containing protein [Terriglobales bacterium]|nr:cache domain-containing protein [Terriglobales bacterium]